MGLISGLGAAGAIHGARQIKALRRDTAAASAREQRWRESQIALVADLRAGRQTLGEAERHLAGIKRAAWRRDPVWWDARHDLVSALRAGRLTLRAAALNLGMIAPDE
jgi:hypothetical protein